MTILMSTTRDRVLLLAGMVALSFVVCSSPSYALSEIKPDDAPAQTGQTESQPAPSTPQANEAERIPGVPTPAPVTPPKTPAGEVASPDAPGEKEPAAEGAAAPHLDPDATPPEILYDTASLPEPVQRMRNLILEATKTGDLEKLRPLLGTGDSQTQLSFGGEGGDPIAFLKENSGDGEGQETLAILEEILQAGYVHLEVGTPDELYVWPYFFAVPVEKLTAPQRVELFRIITAGDYEDMKNYGGYIFYRVGITPQGQWTFFVSGD